MTEHYEAFDDSNDPELMADLRLARYCETMAQNYSEDYREGLDDTCEALVGTGDLGIQTKTTLAFAAERFRVSDDHGHFGKVLSTGYEITSRLECYELKGSDLPLAIRKEVVRKKLCRIEELDDKANQFTLGLELSFDITSEGECETNCSVYVAGRAREIGIKGKAVRAAIASTVETAPADITTATPWDESLFSGIFSDEEKQLMESLAAQLAQNAHTYQPAMLFFKQYAQLRKRLKQAGPHALATALLNELFLPDRAA